MYMATAGNEVLFVPKKLLVNTRSDFRSYALQFVEQQAGAGANEIVLDLTDTSEIDASGLGVLVLVREWAKRHSVPVRLKGVRTEIRSLLDLTRLSGMFVIE